MENDIRKKVFKKTDNAVSRRIASELVIVPIHKEAVDLEAIFSLNNTAARIWELLDEDLDPRQITERIAREFTQDERAIKADVEGFLEQLSELRFIEVKS